MQTLLNCNNYTKNNNLNKTCNNNKRCELYYNNYCKEYEEKTNTNNRNQREKNIK